MPKLKTLRAAAKRFKRTASGKVMRRHAYHSHILTKKTSKRKRHLRGESVIDSSNMTSVQRMLPYGK